MAKSFKTALLNKKQGCSLDIVIKSDMHCLFSGGLIHFTQKLFYISSFVLKISPEANIQRQILFSP